MEEEEPVEEVFEVRRLLLLLLLLLVELAGCEYWSAAWLLVEDEDVVDPY